MTPEAQDYLAKAREDLDDARKIVAIGLAKVAARCTYYAAFHAAEALVAERTGKIAKTHSGVRAEFAKLLKAYPDSGKPLLTFLAQSYKYKEIGDYGVGQGATISDIEATSAIETAEVFIEQVTALISEQRL